MSDPNMVQDPATQSAANPDVSVTPPVSEDSKGETPKQPEPQTEISEPKEDNLEDENLSVEELKQKYSASSKEARLRKEEAELANRKLEEQGEANRRLQDDFLSVVTETRETFEKYLDKQMLSPAERERYLNIYDTQISKGEEPSVPNQPNQQQVTGQAPVQAPSNAPANPVRESWMREMDQEKARKLKTQREASQEFMSDPSNKELDDATLKAIWAQASYLDTKHGLEPKEALARARQVVVETDSIKDEGYVEGVRDAHVSGVNKGVSGGNASKGSPFTLGAKDEAFVNAEIQNRGLSGQQADNFRREYALRLQSKK